MKMYSDFCYEEATLVINNNQLKPMYEAWSKLINKMVDNLPEDILSKLTSPSLLTCSDSYLKSNKRIMFIGREAHHDKGSLNDVFCENSYLTDEYTDYEDEIVKGEAKETNFLKTRRLLSGFDDYNSRLTGQVKDGFKLMSLLVNNLNKTSFSGKATKCDADLNTIYQKFKYDGSCIEANVFIHELNILKPDVLVMLCGRGYDEHIIRAFGENFYEYIKSKQVFDVKQNIKAVSEIILIDKEKVKAWFGIDDYSFSVVYGFHPSARLKKEIRVEYEKALRMAIK